MKSFLIGNYRIEQGGKPFIIAELSGNHNKSLDRALELIDLAIASGAHAIKIQTYTADSITIDSDYSEFQITDPKSLWCGKNLYQLYQEASTPYEWHPKIFEYCKRKGVLCFSTPFDEAAVDFLETLNPPCYKIASFENNHFPLIRRVIKTDKPIIISLGLCTLQDIDELNSFLVKEGAKQFVLLKCTSAYPAEPSAANLSTIPFLHERLKTNIGLSDHTTGIAVAIASVALGAQVIEKHFTDSRAKGGVDSAFSLEPAEMKQLVVETERAWQGLGKATFGLSVDEEKSLIFKRSIYVVQDIAEGEKLSAKNIRIIRPAKGLAPKHYEEVIGKQTTRGLKRGEFLTWEMLKL